MYISDKQLAARFAVARTTIWRWVKTHNEFPQPYNLSPGCTRWKLSEVDAWAEALSGNEGGSA